MLAVRGIISDADRDTLLRGLDAVEAELRGGHFVFSPDDEDIHMAIERHLTELVGPVGGKLHTARSRNDQVATDLVMYVRERAPRRPGGHLAADGRPDRARRAAHRLAPTRLHPPPTRPTRLP